MSTRRVNSVIGHTASYFMLVFGAGFLFGVVRTLYLAPWLGTRAAELWEAPAMLLVIIVAARGLAARFASSPKQAMIVGLLAGTLVLSAEVLVGVGLRGMSIAAVFLDRDPVTGMVYYALILTMVMLPYVLARKRKWSL
jgi:hypothetical protein